MSLLASRKFWTSKLRLRSRLCYLSGFLYYVHTALFTFAGPLIPITLLVAMPELLELRNARLVLPSLVYTTVVFPWWHRSPYRLEAWACRMMYGWAHTFAIWGPLRGRRLGWWQLRGDARYRLLAALPYRQSSGGAFYRVSYGTGSFQVWVRATPAPPS